MNISLNSDEKNMTLATNLMEIRKNKEWSRKKLSEESGITEGGIVKIENGSDPKAMTIKKLVIALGCTSDELLFNEDEISADEKFKLIFSEIKTLNEDDKEFIKKVLTASLSHCQAQRIQEL